MSDNIAEGKGETGQWQSQESSGKVASHDSREIGGKTERVAGKIQVGYGTVKRIIKKATGV